MSVNEIVVECGDKSKSNGIQLILNSHTSPGTHFAKEITDPSWCKTLLQLLQHSFQTQTLCDLLLKFQSGNVIKVHRAILECSCSVPSLGSYCSDNNNILIVHPGIEEDLVILIIRFLYSGRVIIRDGLDDMAKLLGVTGLVAALGAQRLSQMPQETVAAVLPINQRSEQREINTQIFTSNMSTGFNDHALHNQTSMTNYQSKSIIADTGTSPAVPRKLMQFQNNKTVPKLSQSFMRNTSSEIIRDESRSLEETSNLIYLSDLSETSNLPQHSTSEPPLDPNSSYINLDTSSTMFTIDNSISSVIGQPSSLYLSTSMADRSPVSDDSTPASHIRAPLQTTAAYNTSLHNSNLHTSHNGLIYSQSKMTPVLDSTSLPVIQCNDLFRQRPLGFGAGSSSSQIIVNDFCKGEYTKTDALQSDENTENIQSVIIENVDDIVSSDNFPSQIIDIDGESILKTEHAPLTNYLRKRSSGTKSARKVPTSSKKVYIKYFTGSKLNCTPITPQNKSTTCRQNISTTTSPTLRKTNMEDAFDALLHKSSSSNSVASDTSDGLCTSTQHSAFMPDTTEVVGRSALLVPTNSQLLAKANAAARRRGAAASEDEAARPTRFLMEDDSSLSTTAGDCSSDVESSLWSLSGVPSGHPYTLPQYDTSTGSGSSMHSKSAQLLHIPNNLTTATACQTLSYACSRDSETSSVCLKLSNNSATISSAPSNIVNVNRFDLTRAMETEPSSLSNSLVKSTNLKRTPVSKNIPTRKRTKLSNFDETISINCNVSSKNIVPSDSFIKQYGRGNRSQDVMMQDKAVIFSSSGQIRSLNVTPRDSIIDQPSPSAEKEQNAGLLSSVNCYEIKPKSNSSSLGIVPAVTGARVGIEIDGSSTSVTETEQSNHTKIIYEILKKYPNLVKDKKNLKLKIMRTDQNGIELSADGQQYTFSSKNQANALTNTVPATQSVAKPSSASIFQCSKCAATRTTYPLLKQHVLKQHKLCAATILENIEKKLLCCTVCREEPRFFTDKASFEFHNKELHSKPELRRCRMCGYKPVRKLDLAYHMYVVHKIEPPRSVTFPKCDRCEFIAVNQTELLRHRSNHPASDSFTCHTCSVAFRSFGALQGHLQAKACHRKQSVSHNCPHCSRTFTKSYNLKVHIRSQHKTVNAKPETQGFIQETIIAHNKQDATTISDPKIVDSSVDIQSSISEIDTYEPESYLNPTNTTVNLQTDSSTIPCNIVQPLDVYSSFNENLNANIQILPSPQEISNVIYEEVVTTPLNNVSYEEIVQCSVNNINNDIDDISANKSEDPNTGISNLLSSKLIGGSNESSNLCVLENDGMLTTSNASSSSLCNSSNGNVFPMSIIPSSFFPTSPVVEVLTCSSVPSMSTVLPQHQPVMYFTYQLPTNTECTSIKYLTNSIARPSSSTETFVSHDDSSVGVDTAAFQLSPTSQFQHTHETTMQTSQFIENNESTLEESVLVENEAATRISHIEDNEAIQTSAPSSSDETIQVVGN